MGNFLNLIILVGILWVVDAVAFGGRYSAGVWEQARYEGPTVQYGIRDWFKRIGI
jgi:hypothetical protein